MLLKSPEVQQVVVDEIEAALTDTVETEAMSFGQYHIQIGCREIIGHHLSPILAEDATDPENIKKAKKKLQELLIETRVRVGTLLKTDNVSFLIGAGASIKAGGISLASIPNNFEAELLRIAESEHEHATPPGWISQCKVEPSLRRTGHPPSESPAEGVCRILLRQFPAHDSRLCYGERCPPG
jgi:hypothetical protein